MAYELAATWRWPTLAQMNHTELSHMAGAIDDSTINIVVVIIIIIIIIIKTSSYDNYNYVFWILFHDAYQLTIILFL